MGEKSSLVGEKSRLLSEMSLVGLDRSKGGGEKLSEEGGVAAEA